MSLHGILQNVRVVATEEWTSLCDDGRIQGSQDPCLSVGQVCESDAGTYRCQVSNMAGTTLSGTVELVVGTYQSFKKYIYREYNTKVTR